MDAEANQDVEQHQINDFHAVPPVAKVPQPPLLDQKAHIDGVQQDERDQEDLDRKRGYVALRHGVECEKEDGQCVRLLFCHDFSGGGKLEEQTGVDNNVDVRVDHIQLNYHGTRLFVEVCPFPQVLQEDHTVSLVGWQVKEKAPGTVCGILPTCTALFRVFRCAISVSRQCVGRRPPFGKVAFGLSARSPQSVALGECMPEAVAHFAACVRPHTKLTDANGTQEKEYTPVVQDPH
mmetsp:Transcript_14814/g.35309  ORF Transcript_14814/g.35309 Transcript_14814/m.35309 type:complete len:235 (+) Transcript_14814:6022-6726(+)